MSKVQFLKCFIHKLSKVRQCVKGLYIFIFLKLLSPRLTFLSNIWFHFVVLVVYSCALLRSLFLCEMHSLSTISRFSTWLTSWMWEFKQSIWAEPAKASLCFQKADKAFAINKAQLTINFLIIEYIQIQLAKMLLNLFKPIVKLIPQLKTL